MIKKKVRNYIEKYQMIQPGDMIFAGVSGGPDSVCMLILLQDICKEKQADLQVVHLNHLIRKEAGQDAEYVEQLCQKLGTEYHYEEADVEKEAKNMMCGTEEAGRMIRYRILNRYAQMYGDRGKIAVAHNRNDLAETMLFNLFRGSSVNGLSGILPVRDRIIRPLLCLSREEIEEFLKTDGTVQGKWCIDVTNGENIYTRNRIRNELFPYVEKNICSQAAEHVASAAEEMAEVRSYIENEARQACRDCVDEEGNRRLSFSIAKFQKYPPVIQRQMILECMYRVMGSRKDLTAVHIEAVHSLTEKDSGKKISLPYQCTAEKSYDYIIIKKSDPEEKTDDYDVHLLQDTVINGKKIHFQLQKRNDGQKIKENRYTKSFDYDKISNCLMVRTRKKGDYLTINQQQNRKSLSDYLINEKVPREERDKLLLLADGSHILWIIGMRISAYYKVTAETKTVLQVTVGM